ncbi:MAG: ribonuclease P protein component [Holosporaceae bacterium]|nr:ribonuclease P protein component [Holosporaceae bacterium]
MKKSFRIRRRADFVRVSQQGFYWRTNSVVVQCCFNNLNTYRVGVTASKRVGNAVVRNRCKRRIRAVADAILDGLAIVGVDYVFIARRSTYNVKWALLIEDTISSIRFLNNRVLKCKSFCRF